MSRFNSSFSYHISLLMKINFGISFLFSVQASHLSGPKNSLIGGCTNTPQSPSQHLGSIFTKSVSQGIGEQWRNDIFNCWHNFHEIQYSILKSINFYIAP